MVEYPTNNLDGNIERNSFQGKQKQKYRLLLLLLVSLIHISLFLGNQTGRKEITRSWEEITWKIRVLLCQWPSAWSPSIDEKSDFGTLLGAFTTLESGSGLKAIIALVNNN